MGLVVLPGTLEHSAGACGPRLARWAPRVWRTVPDATAGAWRIFAGPGDTACEATGLCGLYHVLDAPPGIRLIDGGTPGPGA
jgi:hypothetical protein